MFGFASSEEYLITSEPHGTLGFSSPDDELEDELDELSSPPGGMMIVISELDDELDDDEELELSELSSELSGEDDDLPLPNGEKYSVIFR
jgi:hypothetical protein